MRDVALVGPAGVGKDTVASILVSEYGYERIAFADALKQALLQADPQVGHTRLRDVVDALGWDQAKTNPEVRRLLQEFGMAMRSLDESIWVRLVYERCVQINANIPLVFTDVRMPNELHFVRGISALVVQLSRPGVDTGTGWRSHVSERAMDGERFDLTIDSDWSPESAVSHIMSTMSLSASPLGVPIIQR